MNNNTLNLGNTNSPNSLPHFVAKNIIKNFGGIKALNNLNFEVSRGEVMGLVGDNGAGTVSYTHLTLPTIE